MTKLENMVGPQEATSSSLCINDTAVMKRANMKKGDMILGMGRCLKNVLIDSGRNVERMFIPIKCLWFDRQQLVGLLRYQKCL